MADFRVATGSLGATLLLRVDITQNVAAKQSTYHSQLFIENVPSATYVGTAGCSITVAGGVNNHNYSWGTGGGTRLIFDVYNTYTHDTNGYLTVGVSAHIDGTGTQGIGGPTDIGTQYVSAPRIAQVPKAPGQPTLSSSSPSSVEVDWTTPDNMGAAISNFVLKADPTDTSTIKNFTTPNAGDPAMGTPQSYTMTGLTPGKSYDVSVAAVNSVGTGPYSAPRRIAIGIGGKRWDGSAEKAFTTAMRWDGTKEVPLTVAKRWNGTAEVDIT